MGTHVFMIHLVETIRNENVVIGSIKMLDKQIKNIPFYNPALLCRVQITRETSITWYLYLSHSPNCAKD